MFEYIMLHLKLKTEQMNKIEFLYGTQNLSYSSL